MKKEVQRKTIIFESLWNAVSGSIEKSIDILPVILSKELKGDDKQEKIKKSKETLIESFKDLNKDKYEDIFNKMLQNLMLESNLSIVDKQYPLSSENIDLLNGDVLNFNLYKKIHTNNCKLKEKKETLKLQCLKTLKNKLQNMNKKVKNKLDILERRKK